MPDCKSCGKEITERQAAASLWDLSYLPTPDGSLSRRMAKMRAAKIGPMCGDCLKRQATLPPELKA